MYPFVHYHKSTSRCALLFDNSVDDICPSFPSCGRRILEPRTLVFEDRRRSRRYPRERSSGKNGSQITGRESSGESKSRVAQTTGSGVLGGIRPVCRRCPLPPTTPDP